MAFNRKQYEHDQAYIKANIKFVNISLNQRKEEDMQMLEWLNKRPEGKGAYIKRLIREDMQKELK